MNNYRKSIEVIDAYLKNNKIKFTVVEENYYELFFGSQSGFIQIEGDDNDDEVIIQLFSKGGDYSFYHEVLNIPNDLTNDVGEFDFSIIEEYIDELKLNVLELIKKLSKIKHHLDIIEEYCNELQINLENILTINYNFDE